jgi:hypothetical protein
MRFALTKRNGQKIAFDVGSILYFQEIDEIHGGGTQIFFHGESRYIIVDDSVEELFAVIESINREA